MNNLLTALMTKISGSAFSSDVGGRVYLDQAPQGAEFPYCVFFVVTANPDRTFTEHYTDALIQFSLFSASSGATEITTAYNDLVALLDECALTISGSKLVWMKEQNLATMIEDVTTQSGTATVKAWHVDFEVKTSLN
ncbi:MAG: DUF3168 domain-containing protein [Syntrophales bacterium]|nr:DUF3168 domain-containing protein [Syntrophales bacterium]